jgi:hypothetical protein
VNGTHTSHPALVSAYATRMELVRFPPWYPRGPSHGSGVQGEIYCREEAENRKGGRGF